MLRTAVRQNFLDFEVLANPDHQLFSYLVTDGRRILRFVIITAFQRSKRTAWSRVPPVFKGPGNLTLVSLPSRDVFVSPSLSSGSENMFDHIDSVLVPLIFEFSPSTTMSAEAPQRANDDGSHALAGFSGIA